MQSENANSGTIQLTNAQRYRRICSVIIPLLFLSLFLAALIISAANDIYAFVKPQKSATITLSEGESAYSLAELLSDRGIIGNPLAFTLYAKLKGVEGDISAFSGQLELDASMSYREILKYFS
ncbi:MAG: endolytic transglycosylase MltG [Ruminococcaceae bacterium]|nr:endolytic transglycosylase MltG [Oscillospiraceae bacterium]